MKVKTIILGFLILILLLTAVLIGRGVWNHMQQRRKLNEALNRFAQIVESGNFDDITLTIYYMQPSIDTPRPLRIDDLINWSNIDGSGVQRFIIDGNRLEEYVDLLKQLSKMNVAPVWRKSYLDARIYYVFNTDEDGKLFDVVMWGYNNSIFVNGIEVRGNGIFYEILIPFLSKEESEILKDFLGGGN